MRMPRALSAFYYSYRNSISCAYWYKWVNSLPKSFLSHNQPYLLFGGLFLLCLMLGFSVWWCIAPEQQLLKPATLGALDPKELFRIAPLLTIAPLSIWFVARTRKQSKVLSKTRTHPLFHKNGEALQWCKCIKYQMKGQGRSYSK